MSEENKHGNGEESAELACYAFWAAGWDRASKGRETDVDPHDGQHTWAYARCVKRWVDAKFRCGDYKHNTKD